MAETGTDTPERPPLPEHLRAEAEARLRGICAGAGAAGGAPPAPRGDPLRVLAVSEFVHGQLQQHPEWLAELAAAPPPDRETADLAGLRGRLRGTLADPEIGKESALMAALRTARNRELTRIAWRDISGLASVETVLAELTGLAEALIDAALERLFAWHCARHGYPRGPDGAVQSLVVLGLGKLGSMELNFSSDIDLIFAYPQGGRSDGADRPLANEAFFARLAQRLIHVLGERTEDGFVYRVDMRLRPFGRSGALAASFDALEDYYQTFGRDWERFALVRARPVAGDRAAGAALVARLRPFIFRRYVDFGALESLREVKERIARDLRGRPGEPEEGDIKRGRGGIRELEFVVQALQVLRGARHPELRRGSILELLPRLAERRLLPAADAADLAGAYRFLRTLENRLQQHRDQQTHLLPREPAHRERIAVAMGYTHWDALIGDLDRHRDRVQGHFHAVLGAPDNDPRDGNRGEDWSGDGSGNRGQDPRAQALVRVWDELESGEHADRLLGEAGFTRPGEVRERLARLRENYRTRALDERGRRRLGKVVGTLLAEAGRHRPGADPAAGPGSDPARTVDRVVAVVESVVQRAAYLALLTERPVALRQLVRLCAASPWVAQHLARHPQSFDELIDPRTLYAPPGRAELERALAERFTAIDPGDTEEEMNALRYFQQANALRVAAAEISGAIALMTVSNRLSDLAEVCLEKALELAWRDLTGRHGKPTFIASGHRHPQTAPFAIIAYGKLGGLELSYGSDLDLVFIHGSEGEHQVTDGHRSVDNPSFFARLGQRIIHTLATHTSAGRLYEVDARLRPNGSAGLLVTGIGAFEAYQHEQAWTWEHQALVRARPVAGDRALRARFEQVRRRVLAAPRDLETLKAEVREMRVRMQRELGSKPGQRYHLKQDPGGIADIEFLVQYGTLRWAQRLGESIQYTDNIRLLEAFAAHRVLSHTDAVFLGDAYRALRSRVHELDLQALPARVDRGAFESERAGVLRLWREWME